MNEIHQDLLNKHEWYRKWHENPMFGRIHWALFGLVVVISSLVLYSAFKIPVALENTSASASARDGGISQGSSGGKNSDDVFLLTKKLLDANFDHKDTLSKKDPESQEVKDSFNKISELTKQRRAALANLIKKNPKLALESVLSVAQQAELPPEVAGLFETQVVLEGKVDELIADNIANNTSVHLYQLVDTDSGARYNLHFAKAPGKVLGGKKVRVSGIELDGNVAVASVTVTSSSLSVDASSQTAGLFPTVSKKVAVIMFNFTNDSSQPFNQDFAKNVVYASTTSSVKNYIKEDSFGQWEIQGKVNADGDVYGWYTIPYTNADCLNKLLTWAAAADTAAAASGFDRSGYDVTHYMFPNTSNCPFSGIAYVGSPYSFINGTPTQYVSSHEMGHNFRLFHASGFMCYDDFNNRVTLSNRCNINEYGDPFDTMGSAPAMRHFNDRHKGQTGPAATDWLAPENKHVVVNPGTYTITPIEKESTGIQSLSIPRVFTYYDQYSVLQTVTDGSYYVEFRQPYGYDNFAPSDPAVNGVIVRLSNGYSGWLQSFLLDMNPGTATFSDAPLALGKTFSDTATGISISVIALDSNGATVRVNLPATTCVQSNPSVSIVPASQSGKAGQTLTYTATFTNNDNSLCAPSTFDLTTSLPSGWSQTPSSMSEVIPPGNSVVKTLLVTSAASTTPATYTFTETTTNLDFPAYSGSASANYVVPAPVGDGKPPVAKVTAPPDQTTYTKDTTVKVTGTGSDADGIASIQLLVDTKSLGTCTSVTTCTKSLNTKTLTVGAHTLTANVTDKSGDKSSATITIYKTKPVGRGKQ